MRIDIKNKAYAYVGMFAMISRELYFFCIQGIHTDMYFMKANCLKDVSQYISVLALFALNYKYNMDGKVKLMFKLTIGYCAIMSVLMFYPFLPVFIASKFHPVHQGFNIIWPFIIVACFLTLMIKTHNNEKCN